MCGEREDSVLTRDPPFFFLPPPLFLFLKSGGGGTPKGQRKTEEEEKKSLGGTAGRRVATLNRRKTGLDFEGWGARWSNPLSLTSD